MREKIFHNTNHTKQMTLQILVCSTRDGWGQVLSTASQFQGKDERWKVMGFLRIHGENECVLSSEISLVFIPLCINRWGQGTIQQQPKARWVKIIEDWKNWASQAGRGLSEKRCKGCPPSMREEAWHLGPLSTPPWIAWQWGWITEGHFRGIRAGVHCCLWLLLLL